MSLQQSLARGITALGLDEPASTQAKLLDYLALLAKWNRTYNLTAIRDPEKMLVLHLLDSLAVLPHVPEGALADIGSGGGLPGIPIAIVRAHQSVTLNDANAKKAAFLRQAQIELKLPKVQVHEGRCEDWNPVPPFASVISRGFAALETFFVSCRHLLRPGGEFLALKGTYPAEEIDALPANAEVREVVRLHLPEAGVERHLIRMGDRAA